MAGCFVAIDAEAAAAVNGVTAGEIDDDDLARWVRDRWPKDVPRT